MVNENGANHRETVVAAILAAVNFPVSRHDLVEAARDAEAEKDVIKIFKAIPKRVYMNRDEVNQVINAEKYGGWWTGLSAILRKRGRKR